MSLNLRPFQKRAVKALESGSYDTVVLSLSRSQGKSSLAAELCFRALTPGDVLHRPGTESHLVAATIGQSRKTCFKLLRALVEDSDRANDYKVSESANACHIRRKACNTRVSVVAGSAKSTLGLVHCPLVVVDEPGSFELDGGAALWDSLTTAQGKPESDLRLFCIGHLAPRATGDGHWYFDLVKRGTRGRTWVYAIQGRRDRWDSAAEIRRCSPLSWSYPKSRAKLLEQRDEARADSRLKAAFLSYRLNQPSEDESRVLLTVADVEAVLARPVGAADGQPVIGIDLGSGRAWSAAVALWRSGRMEAIAVCPGVPDIAEQERADKVNPGAYQRLVDSGKLHVADGLHVPRPAQLMALAKERWSPFCIVADRHRYPELLDCINGVPVLSEVNDWKHGGLNVRALRKMAKDGPLSLAPDSIDLLITSLRVSRVEGNGAGDQRMVKMDAFNNRCRDDVAAALLLAAGRLSRLPPIERKRSFLAQ